MQVFFGGQVASLGDFDATPSLLNYGSELSITLTAGTRYWGAITGRYRPPSTLTADQIELLKIQGKTVKLGWPVYPLVLSTYPVIPMSGQVVIPSPTIYARLLRQQELALEGLVDDRDQGPSQRNSGTLLLLLLRMLFMRDCRYSCRCMSLPLHVTVGTSLVSMPQLCRHFCVG